MRKDLIVMELSDEALLSGLGRMVLKERLRQSQFLAYLAEVEKRQLFAKQGYSSLFAFVVERCGLSESSALKRIQVARVARRLPLIYSFIEAGKISLTGLSKLAPFLNSTNEDVLLGEASHKSVRQIEKVIVKYFPKANVKDSVTQKVAPLSIDSVSVHFTASEAFAKKLEHLKDRLSHKYPEARLADIFEEAMDALLKKLNGKGMATGEAPVQAEVEESPDDHTALHTRYIPRGIRQKVRERDDHRCQFVSKSGKRCEATHFLHFDHVEPWALGGSSKDAENIQLLCAVHNRLRAAETFGDGTFRWQGPMALGAVRQGSTGRMASGL